MERQDYCHKEHDRKKKFAQQRKTSSNLVARGFTIQERERRKKKKGFCFTYLVQGIRYSGFQRIRYFLKRSI